MSQDDQNLDHTGEVRRVESNSDEEDSLGYPEDEPNRTEDLEEEENTGMPKPSKSSPGLSLLEASSPYLSPVLETVTHESPDASGALDQAALLRKQIEELATFTFPDTVQTRLDGLMEKNNEGKLSSDEREELRALVELSELVSLLKGQARLFLHHSA